MDKCENRRHRGMAAAFPAVVLSCVLAGCVDPPMQNTGYRTYGTPATSRPAPTRQMSQSAKIVSPERSASSTEITRTKTLTAGGIGKSGQLDDIASRIRSRDADKAKAEEARRREERERWLGTHEGELAIVRTRLKSMRVFAVTASDAGLREKVRAAVAATESDIDALRSSVGDGAVGFSDAAAIRTALQTRHEALAAASEEYRSIVK